jgi:hypothetical protein
MNEIYGWAFRSLMGWLLALPQQFVAIHGWPGLAAMVAAGVFLAKLIRRGARPWIEIPVLALVSLAAWCFWPERKAPVAVPQRALMQRDAAKANSPFGVFKQRKASSARKSKPRQADLVPAPMPLWDPHKRFFMRVVPGVHPGHSRMPVIRPNAGHAKGITAVKAARFDHPVGPLCRHSAVVGLCLSIPTIHGRSRGGHHLEAI